MAGQDSWDDTDYGVSRRRNNFFMTLAQLGLFVAMLIGIWAFFAPAIPDLGSPAGVLPEVIGNSWFVQSGFGQIVTVVGSAFLIHQSL